MRALEISHNHKSINQCNARVYARFLCCFRAEISNMLLYTRTDTHSRTHARCNVRVCVRLRVYSSLIVDSHASACACRRRARLWGLCRLSGVNIVLIRSACGAYTINRCTCGMNSHTRPASATRQINANARAASTRPRWKFCSRGPAAAPA